MDSEVRRREEVRIRMSWGSCRETDGRSAEVGVYILKSDFKLLGLAQT